MTRVVVLVLFGIIFLSAGVVRAQFLTSGEEDPGPKGALLRSAVLPGWGHYYVNSGDWNRGKYHLVAEVVLLTSFFGLHVRSNHFQNDLVTYARSNAGTDLEGRDRRYKLAVGNFGSRQAHNEYYLRTRNWDRLYPDEEQYRWNWSSDEARSQYQDLRERIDRIDRQLPALLTLMVVNRVVSGVSAFLRARDVIEQQPAVGMVPTTNGGVATRIQIPF